MQVYNHIIIYFKNFKYLLLTYFVKDITAEKLEGAVTGVVPKEAVEEAGRVVEGAKREVDGVERNIEAASKCGLN